MESTTCSVPADRTTAWPVAALLLDALTQRDFDAMRSLFASDIRFRALVPPGAVEFHTADEAAAKFRTWFGGDDAFEVLDASLGQVGSRLYVRWRVKLTPADRPDESRVAEQHVYTTGTRCIETLDLLCSGFHKDLA